MSTAGRINKGGTKFVPKRKPNPSSSFAGRASSATPALPSTPSLSAAKELAPLPSISETADSTSQNATASGSGGEIPTEQGPGASRKDTILVSDEDHEVFVAPKARPVASGSAFAPSDPSSSSSRTNAFPSSSFATSSAPTQFTAPSSPPPRSTTTSTAISPIHPSTQSPVMKVGTAFGVSASGPTKPPAAPPAPTASSSINKPASASAKKHVPPALPPASTSKDKGKGKASTSATPAADSEPRTQGEIEVDAEEASKKVADKKEKANAKRRETAKAKREADKAGGKGKKRAAEGVDEANGEEQGEEQGGDTSAQRPAKKSRTTKPPNATGEGEGGDGPDGPMLPPTTTAKAKKPRAPRKPKAKVPLPIGSDGEVDVYDELAPKKRRRKNKTGERVKPSQMDIALFGTPASEDDEEGGSGEDGVVGSSSSEEDDTEASMEEGSDGEMKYRKRKKVKTGKKAKKGRQKIPERVTVDPDVTTMSFLSTARDIVGGRMSERGKQLARKADDKKQARKDARAKMRDRAARRKRGEDVSDDEQDTGSNAGKASAANSRRGSPAASMRSDPAGPRAGSPALLDAVAAALGRGDIDLMDNLGGKENDNAADSDDDYGDLVETEYAPQMRIVDGELVIDDASLEIDRAARAQADFVGTREVIEESAKDRMVNSGTWGKQVRTEKWTVEETELFYDLLSQFGTDFEMIAAMFPTRTRRQIKAKYTKEDKLTPHLITIALKRRKNIDLVSYAKVTGQDLSGPIPEDPFEKIQKIRMDMEAKAAASGEPVFGNVNAVGSSSKAKGKGRGKDPKGKGKGREGDESDGGHGSDDDGALAEGGEDEDYEEEERRRLEEEAAAAAIDAEIAAAEALEASSRKKK
ncbi:transcription factor TFIIIB component B'', partial [Phenoliferia sp. Uapishka_3]